MAIEITNSVPKRCWYCDQVIPANHGKVLDAFQRLGKIFYVHKDGCPR